MEYDKLDPTLPKDSDIRKKAKQRRNNINQNLDLLRNIYGISYILGYRELANNFPLDFQNYGIREWVFVITAIALILLSIRFFWGVGVIRRYLQLSIEFTEESLKNSQAVDGRPIRKVMSRFVPILLMHSFMFFILCRISSDIFLTWKPDQNIPSQFVYEFISIYALLLIINSIWLHRLKVKNFSNSHLDVWIINNALSALTIFIAIFLQFSNILFSNDMIYIYGFALFIFYLNSIIDLLSVSDAYLLARPG